MKRIASLWLPSFATDRLARNPAYTGSRSSPLATVAKQRGQLAVLAANGPAQAAGIAPGHRLADARALEPGLRVVEADPLGDQKALAALADWCTRFTPWATAEEADMAGGGGVLLDITGCAHLFGGEAELLADLVGRLERQGVAARAAIADTAGAAWAIARFGGEASRVVPPDGQRQALAPLPAAALRLASETVAGLERLGLRRIGDLYALPRAPLARRFGLPLCRRLDQALGSLDEPLSPRLPSPPWRLQLAFAEPVAAPGDIAAGLERLLAALCRRLEEETKGARRLVFALYRVDGTVGRAEIGTSAPVRDPQHLARLFAEKLERLDPGLGLDLMTLTAPVVEDCAPLQASLLDAVHDDGASQIAARAELGALVDRLANRLGFAQVRRLVPVASHLPERAQRALPAHAPDGALAAAKASAAAWRRAQPRPLRLFVRPQPIDAVAPVPDDPPLLFRWRQELHRIRRADGPERIAAEWWRDGAPAGAELRDYYRVEDESGRRFWLFREGLYDPAQTPRWFLHGLFA